MANGPVSAWFSAIETREQAEKTISDASIALIVIAVLQGALWFTVFGPSALVDAAFLVVIGILLRRFKSRAVAVVFAIYSVGGTVGTIANDLGMNILGARAERVPYAKDFQEGLLRGRSLTIPDAILSLILVFLAVRAVQATYKRKKLPAAPGPAGPGKVQ